MISVGNFYWILYQNLLEPAGLNCYSHYPFGTQDNLVMAEFLTAETMPRLMRRGFVFFYYDQEPIWCNELGTVFDQEIIWYAWTNKIPKLLANSEHSVIKKQLCRDRNMLDWYFFYHGFAALDWFRDCQYIENHYQIQKVFCSYNHLVTGYRAYRMALIARLLDAGLCDRGDISFHGTTTHCLRELDNPASLLSASDRQFIRNNLCDSARLPMTIDKTWPDGNLSSHLGIQEYTMWQRSFLHLVTETVFYPRKLHLTEKIFKPIISQRPFVLVASSGNLQYLKSYGFRTFDRWWDESYDDLEDPDARLDAVTKIVTDLCSRPFAEIQDMLEDMKPVLLHNKQHFFGEFRRIIADELVENFDTCIRVWNHGRVDGRQYPCTVDLERVKKLLLQ